MPKISTFNFGVPKYFCQKALIGVSKFDQKMVRSLLETN